MNYTWWTKAMENYLTKHYAWKGDKELAQMFEKRFPKPFPWTNKQIEKKRGYMGLKHSKEQLRYIHKKNQQDGRQKKMWDTRGRMQEGEVRCWDGRQYIKHNGKVILLHRHLVNAKKGQLVRQFEGGLQIITRRENAILNAAVRKSRTPELKQSIKLLNQINKIIHAKQANRP
jgi:hypothetical protein